MAIRISRRSVPLSGPYKHYAAAPSLSSLRPMSQCSHRLSLDRVMGCVGVIADDALTLVCCIILGWLFFIKAVVNGVCTGIG